MKRQRLTAVAVLAMLAVVTAGSCATEWRSEVMPQPEGKHNLHLTLTAIIDVDGRQTQRSIRTLDRDIEIYVTWKLSLEGFFKKNWQWLWAAVLLPLFGWGCKKWKDT